MADEVAAGPEAGAAFVRRGEWMWDQVKCKQALLRAGEFASVGKLFGTSGPECNGMWTDVEKAKPENELAGRSGTALRGCSCDA
ncbi:unnamed protein product [Clonostachys solani]|uniref:Uncharacterized protein n=1 Tax=Clonostachys solani TaxID=160281 RepID=A0A9N9ZBM8_9HYPO|nr:unnamed protein product [Clonostachys solani]